MTLPCIFFCSVRSVIYTHISIKIGIFVWKKLSVIILGVKFQQRKKRRNLLKRKTKKEWKIMNFVYDRSVELTEDEKISWIFKGQKKKKLKLHLVEANGVHLEEDRWLIMMNILDSYSFFDSYCSKTSNEFGWEKRI